MAPPITRLGYALLGLIKSAPRSGYALRMVFETTPISTYSSSPGSIYPALKVLERAGLVAQRPPAGAKRVFQLTEAGESALRAWLTAPVAEEEVAKRLDMALLRFAFLEVQQDPAATLRFLDSFEAAAKAHAASLERFLEGAAIPALTLQGRIAVEHGLKSILCSAAWAADARRRLRGETT
jgi:DNA-binding PadR family transcriptional regulator